MAAASTPSPASPPNNVGLQPDEPVWIRYSPHGELPLSSVSSFVIHGLVIGLACLAIWTASRFLDHPTRSLPIQTVRLGGGGGDPNGVSGGTGTGTSAPKEEVGAEQPSDPSAEVSDPALSRPDLPPVEGPKATPIIPDPNAKPTPAPSRNMGAFAALASQSAHMRRAEQAGPKGHGGPRSKGKGGPGDGGGKGSGRGNKEGAGSGPGEGGREPMTKREKRMARWAMLFDTHSGPDYVRQLAALGADLAFPVRSKGEKDWEYEVVPNKKLLRPPVRLEKKDLSKYKGIHWIDDNPESVTQVIQALGLRMKPPHFVAFMPMPLEDEMAKLEKAYKGLAEDDIYETRFKIFNGHPVVVDQTPKSAVPGR